MITMRACTEVTPQVSSQSKSVDLAAACPVSGAGVYAQLFALRNKPPLLHAGVALTSVPSP